MAVRTIRKLSLVLALLPVTLLAQAWDVEQVPALEIECFEASPGAGTRVRNALTDGRWLQSRGNRKLTGHSPLVGNIVCPEELWNYDLAARRGSSIAIIPGEGESQLDLPTSGSLGPNVYDVLLHFGYGGTQVDLNNDGYPDQRFFQRHERILENPGGNPAYRRVTCSSDELQIDDPQNEIWCGLQLFDENNGWSLPPVWLAGPLDGTDDGNGGTPLVADFDADGDLEAIIRDWYFFHVLDLETGAIEHSFEFKDRFVSECDPVTKDCVSGRAYGWWSAVNIDDDPELEVVFVADREQFLRVVDNNNGVLGGGWLYRIEIGVNSPTAQLVAGVNPVVDIDGDGHVEVVVTVLNDDGEHRWRVYGYDAQTGERELDLVDRRLQGLGDLDGDGVQELLLLDTSGPGVPEFGTLRIASFDGGQMTELWSLGDAGFAMLNEPFLPLHVNAATIFDLMTAFVRPGFGDASEPVIATEEAGPSGLRTVRFWQSTGGTIAEVGSASGPGLKVQAFSATAPERGILLRAVAENAAESHISLSGLEGAVIQSDRVADTDGHFLPGGRQWGLMQGSVVAPLEPGAYPTVIATGLDEQLHALRIDESATPQVLWRKPGRGMYTESAIPQEGVLLANTTGDGTLSVITAVRNAAGRGEIRALRADGSIDWARALPAPGEMPDLHQAGIVSWAAGYYRNAEREDIAASYRLSTAHSSVLQLLDGRTGQPGWTQNASAFCAPDNNRSTGAGAALLSHVDFDGDGRDELISTARFSLSIFDGDDGSLLDYEHTHGYCDNQPLFGEDFSVSSGAGPVADFVGDGTEQVLWAGHPVLYGVLRTNKSLVWKSDSNAVYPNYRSVQGIGDLNGDGSLEIISVGLWNTNQEIRVNNAANGTLRWTLPIPELNDGSCDNRPLKTTHVATGDIDGDGRDEAVFGVCNFLLAIGESPSDTGQYLWRVRFPHNQWGAFVNDPVIADVHGNGRPQVLVNTYQGYLYGLGTPETPNPFLITPALNDAWANLATPGQGFFINVFPDTGKLFLAWFAFDTERPPGSVSASFGDPGHRWLTAFGSYEGSRAVLDIEITTGGQLNDPQTTTTETYPAQLIIDFLSCNEAIVSFNIPGIGIVDAMRINRVSDDNTPACENETSDESHHASQPPPASPQNGNGTTLNAGMNDAWWNPATPGQGFFLNVFPGLGQVFLGWFTFDNAPPDSTATAQWGGTGQRWAVGFGSFEGNRAEMELLVPTGGVFNAATPPVDEVVDGSLILEMSDCMSGILTAEIQSLGQAMEIPFQRVSNQNVPRCEAAQQH